eukprot:7326300-Prymnesium_polylepis.1
MADVDYRLDVFFSELQEISKTPGIINFGSIRAWSFLAPDCLILQHCGRNQDGRLREIVKRLT